MHIHGVHTDTQTAKHLKYTYPRVVVKPKRLKILTKTLTHTHVYLHALPCQADTFCGVAADAGIARPTSSLLPPRMARWLACGLRILFKVNVLEEQAGVWRLWSLGQMRP